MTRFEINMYELRCQIELIREEHPGCGLENIYYQLNPEGIGRDRFVTYFMEMGYGIKVRKNYRKTTIPTHLRYPNLIEGLLVYQINMVWQSDITYYRVGDVFYYIVFIVDVYSRRILAYQVSDHLRAEANIRALKRALQIRDTDLSNLIHHSDRGSQYVDKDYLQILNDENILISMGLRGQENAYAERVNGIIKNEYLNHWEIHSFDMLREKVEKAVNHYNHKRPHRSLPGRSTPIAFEKQLKLGNKNMVYNEWIFSEKLNINQKDYTFENTGFSEKYLVCPLIDG